MQMVHWEAELLSIDQMERLSLDKATTMPQMKIQMKNTVIQMKNTVNKVNTANRKN